MFFYLPGVHFGHRIFASDIFAYGRNINFGKIKIVYIPNMHLSIYDA